jgi:hypothetical protein
MIYNIPGRSLEVTLRETFLELARFFGTSMKGVRMLASPLSYEGN